MNHGFMFIVCYDIIGEKIEVDLCPAVGPRLDKKKKKKQ